MQFCFMTVLLMRWQVILLVKYTLSLSIWHNFIKVRDK